MKKYYLKISPKIFIIIGVIFILNKSYGLTISENYDGGYSKAQVGNEAATYSYNPAPTYIYRNIREEVGIIQWYSGDRKWWGFDQQYGRIDGNRPYTIESELTVFDSEGGQYEFSDWRFVCSRGNVNNIQQIGATKWKLDQGSDNVYVYVTAYAKLKYTLNNSNNIEDKLITVTSRNYINIHPTDYSSGYYLNGSSTRNRTIKFATYTNLNVNDIDFGTLIPNTSKNYEKISTITVGGGKNATLNIGVNAGSGTVFGQKTIGKLIRTGGSEYIPVEFSIVDNGGNIISNIVMDANWGGTAYLRGFIPSYTLTPKLPRGRYNGTVTIEVTTQ